jgi:maleylacetate reductase
MRLMVGALLHSHEDWEDLSARQDCLEAAWLAIQGLAMGVDAGASHGIGHALGGTAGMPHGETSCVMLPHVLRYNAPVNAARQAALAEAVGQPGRALADILANLVGILGLPERLRDAGVRAEQMGAIAAAAMHDPWVHSNPRPLPTQDDVYRILQSAW